MKIRNVRYLWLRMRSRALRILLQILFRPEPAGRLVRLGTPYGGKVVPDEVLTSKSICYLAGVGEDISFDIELIKRYGCMVYAFDPTPRAIDFIRRMDPITESYSYWPVGLWHSNGIQRFYAPTNPANVSHSIVNLQRTQGYFEAECRSLANLMAELHHDHIDLLKLDIEGAEYGVLYSMLEHGLDVGVICVEFDQPYPFRETVTLIRRMRAEGYAVAVIDGWDVTFVRRHLQSPSLEERN